MVTMSKYVIEKGVPLTGRKGKTEFPFAEMEVDDSFYTEHKHMSAKACEWVRTKAANKNIKFATRQEGEGTRVWRIQ